MKYSLSGFSDCTILVVGDIILDVYFMGEVKRLSPEAPVPIVRITEKTATLGGAGNVALNVVGLGCNAILLGVRGDDDAGASLESILRQRGIQRNLIVDPSRSTTSKTRVIGHGQQLLRLDEEETKEVSESIRRSILSEVENVLSEVSAVILSDYDKGVLNGEMPQEIIRRARAKGIPVFVDPKRKGWERYAGATCVTPNTSELEQVTATVVDHNEELLVASARSLREQFHLDWCLVTRGAKGMCLVGADTAPLFITAAAREVYDVSGAGDTVIATLACAAASGFSLPVAAEISNRAAGIVVGKLGSQAITKSELEVDLQTQTHGSRMSGSSKITNLSAAQIQVKAWRSAGEKAIYAGGRFDRLHPAHVHLLRQASELGGRLLVGLESDDSLYEKGTSLDPTISEHDRAFVLSALECVDLIVVFRRNDEPALLAALRPEIVVQLLSEGREEDARRLVESYGGKYQPTPPLRGLETVAK